MHGSVGGGSLATAPTLTDGAEPDCVGIRGLPRGAGGTDRRSTPPPEGGRGTEAVSTALQRRRWPRNLRPFVRPLPSFLFLFRPAFFCFSLSLPGEGRCSRGPSCGIRHRPEKWQSHPAPCDAAEERRADAGSVRFGLSAPGGRPPLPHGPVMSIEEGEGA
jgi:hypothetical protein